VAEMRVGGKQHYHRCKLIRRLLSGAASCPLPDAIGPIRHGIGPTGRGVWTQPDLRRRRAESQIGAGDRTTLDLNRAAEVQQESSMFDRCGRITRCGRTRRSAR
jgi:hypothetical protein